MTDQAPILSILNFSHIYEEERFYQHERIHWIDCTDLSGTDGFCDEKAAKEIRKRISLEPIRRIHFIDSGNYHYITRFWIEKILTPFSLVVFDHHSDMQKPLFSDLLSCGDWILDSLKKLPLLKKVILVGLSKEQEARIPTEFRDRVLCVDSSHLNLSEAQFSQLCGKFPIYISIDKDVLSKKVVNTSWDQGIMSLSQLRQMLAFLLCHREVLGIDICGECPDCIEFLKSISQNDRINLSLLKFLESLET